jgi:integrase/recombinase XerD
MPRKGTHRDRAPISDPRDPHGWHALTESFCEWMSVQNYSPKTVDNRRTYLRYFVQWALERGLHQPMEITKAILERYQRHLFHYRKRDGLPMSARSMHARLIPVRAFFKWAARQNRILYNPASEIDLPRSEKRLPKHVLNVSEVETILSRCNLADPLGVRDRAMLETFYSTGMRRSELANLKVMDLDYERGTVMVRQGKGRKDRMIPIGERALAWIKRYLDEVRPSLVREPDAGVLFLTNLFEPFTPNRLTQLVRDYIDAAELGKRGSCHLLRHTCATLMLEGGADIRFIQQLLGHAELSTTQIYTQVSIQKLKQVHAATHPARLERSDRNGQAAAAAKPKPPTQTPPPSSP